MQSESNEQQLAVPQLGRSLLGGGKPSGGRRPRRFAKSKLKSSPLKPPPMQVVQTSVSDFRNLVQRLTSESADTATPSSMCPLTIPFEAPATIVPSTATISSSTIVVPQSLPDPPSSPHPTVFVPQTLPEPAPSPRHAIFVPQILSDPPSPRPTIFLPQTLPDPPSSPRDPDSPHHSDSGPINSPSSPVGSGPGLSPFQPRVIKTKLVQPRPIHPIMVQKHEPQSPATVLGPEPPVSAFAPFHSPTVAAMATMGAFTGIMSPFSAGCIPMVSPDGSVTSWPMTPGSMESPGGAAFRDFILASHQLTMSGLVCPGSPMSIGSDSPMGSPRSSEGSLRGSLDGSLDSPRGFRPVSPRVSPLPRTEDMDCREQ